LSSIILFFFIWLSIGEFNQEKGSLQVLIDSTRSA